MHRFQCGDHGHEQWAGDIPLKAAVAALDIFLEGDQVLVVLHHIDGVVLFKNMVDIHQRGELAQLGEHAVVVQKRRLERFIGLGVLLTDLHQRLVLFALEQAHRQKFADDHDIAGLLVKAQIAGALTVGIHAHTDNIPSGKLGAVGQEGRLLFFRIIKAAGGTNHLVADLLHATHTQWHIAVTPKIIVVATKILNFYKEL